MRRNVPCATTTRTGRCALHNDTGNPDAYYEPNSYAGPVEDKRYQEPPLDLEGAAARYDHRDGNDDYRQPAALFALLDEGQRERLFSNVAAAMQGVPQPIVDRQLAHFTKCDPAYGAGVAAALDRVRATPRTSEAAE